MTTQQLKQKVKSCLNLKRKVVREKFQDNVVEYVRVSKMSFEEQCNYFGLAYFRFLKGAKVKYTEYARRKGGYSCMEYTIENALIKIENNTAYIISYNLNSTLFNAVTKRMSGKHLTWTNSKDITAKTYKKHYKILRLAIINNSNNYQIERNNIREKERAENLEKEKLKKELFNKELRLIKVDEIWQKEKEIALQLYGLEKNDAFIVAFKGLLNRNNIEKVNYFYQLMKVL